MQHQADIELVRRVLAQDRAAFDEFFETYFARLCRFCAARMRQPDAVEDIVQETLLRALLSLHTYRGEAMLFSWLCQICRNEISTWYARQGRAAEVTVSLDDDPNIRAALESLGAQIQSDLAHDIALTDLVQLTLDYLPDKYGKALEWKYLEGASVKEIAARLGVGRLAAQSMLARARTAFRQGFHDLQHELSTPSSG